MVLSATGPLSLTAIQTEFGGTNPISMSEYYRNAGFTTTNNENVPTSGTITIGNFLSAFKTTTVAQLTAAFKTIPYSSVRNVLFSKYAVNNGLETNLNSTFSDGGGANRGNSTVTATYTWPTSFLAAFDPLLQTSYITFVMRNKSPGTLTNAIRVNGTNRTLTNYSGSSQLFSYCNVPVALNAMKGLTATVTYTKGTDGRQDNLQELFVLPGKWEFKASASSTFPSSASLGTVAVDDIVFSLRTGSDPDSHNTSEGTYSGTSTGTEILRRATRWYSNATSIVRIVNTAGTLSFNPGSHEYYDSSGNLTSTTNFSGFSVVLTCTQA
jgi:hypothetical protein